MTNVTGSASLPERVYSTNADWPHEAFSLKDGTVPFDLSGYAIRMQLRAAAEASTAYLDLSTDRGQITINDPVAGSFSIWAPASQMSLIPPGEYLREILISKGTETIYIGQGAVTIVQGLVR